MPAVLEMLQYHDTDHVTDMQGIRSRVDSYICSSGPFEKFFFCSGHDVLYHASPLQFLYKILPRIECGMDAEACEAVIRELYY